MVRIASSHGRSSRKESTHRRLSWLALVAGASLALTPAVRASAATTASTATTATTAGTATRPTHPVKAKPVAPRRQLHASGRYLALGDSVAFGYTPSETTPAGLYANAANFVSYPQDVAKALGLRLTNASCPGETTTSFVSASAQSNGCESSPAGGPGYRTGYPLHVSYGGTQLAYALGFLKAHPDTSLVTLEIGANDAFLCEETTADNCTNESGPTFANIAAGVGTILRALRSRAHYTGSLALVTYYSTDYRSPLQNALTQQLNLAVTDQAAANKVSVVNGYNALGVYADYAAGDTCGAGLLVKLPNGTCNVHPTPFGHLILAQAVEESVHGIVGREVNRQA